MKCKIKKPRLHKHTNYKSRQHSVQNCNARDAKKSKIYCSFNLTDPKKLSKQYFIMLN